jgi:hypothetical protein
MSAGSVWIWDVDEHWRSMWAHLADKDGATEMNNVILWSVLLSRVDDWHAIFIHSATLLPPIKKRPKELVDYVAVRSVEHTARLSALVKETLRLAAPAPAEALDAVSALTLAYASRYARWPEAPSKPRK